MNREEELKRIIKNMRTKITKSRNKTGKRIYSSSTYEKCLYEREIELEGIQLGRELQKQTQLEELRSLKETLRKEDKGNELIFYLEAIERELAKSHQPATNIMSIITHIQVEVYKLQQENQQLKDDKYHIQTEMKERINRELDRQRVLKQQISNMQITKEEGEELYFLTTRIQDDCHFLTEEDFIKTLKSKGLIK